jgi:hypothetical protein
MIIVAYYSHKGGLEFLQRQHPYELLEIIEVIKAVDASKAFGAKVSRERTMPGRKLYSPKELNRLFAKEFQKRGWRKERLKVRTEITFWQDLPSVKHSQYRQRHEGYREMDFVKNKVGVEVQLGKYAFMVYNVAAKMTIFARQGVIEVGVEIVPMKRMATQMSTGVEYVRKWCYNRVMR